MNKLLVLGLLGGAVYWLLREPSPRSGSMYLLEGEASAQDLEDSLTRGALDRDEEQELLDEALAESFPASDPPSMSTHRRPAGP